MHGESAALEDVVAVTLSHAVMLIAGVPNGVDELPARLQRPANLGDDRMNLLGGQCHTQRHVGENGIKGPDLDGQWLAQVVHDCPHPTTQALRMRGSAQLCNRYVAEIGGQHLQTRAGEMEAVPALAGRQFQHPVGPGSLEDLECVPGRQGRAGPIHRRVRPVGVPWFKSRWTRLVPATVERSTYVLLSSLLLFLLFWQWRTMPAVIWAVSWPPAKLLVLGLFWLGWIIVFTSTFMINHFDLFGLRQVYLAARARSYSHLEFRTTMLYRLVRHPIMLGFIVAFWATGAPSRCVALRRALTERH